MKKIINKIIVTAFCILAIFMAQVPAMAANLPITFAASHMAAAAGESVTVPIWVSSGSGILSLKMELEYDKDLLELTNITEGDLILDATFDADIPLSRFSFLETTPLNNAGIIVNLIFKVADDAPEGKIPVALKITEIYDADMADLTDLAMLSDGSVTVTAKAAEQTTEQTTELATESTTVPATEVTTVPTTVPATEADTTSKTENIPQTGDGGYLMPGLLLACAGAFTALVLLRLKKNEMREAT